MTPNARDVLASFDALSTAEILRRSGGEGELPEAALQELAAELFRGYDAEEAARGLP